MRKLLLYISGLLALALAGVHGARYVQGWDIIVAGRVIPMEISMYAAIGLLVFGLLCIMSGRRA